MELIAFECGMCGGSDFTQIFRIRILNVDPEMAAKFPVIKSQIIAEPTRWECRACGQHYVAGAAGGRVVLVGIEPVKKPEEP